jgi:hypothetical protein
MLQCFTSLPKTSLGFSLRYSAYTKWAQCSMKVLMAEDRSVIKFYELQYLNKGGRCVKEKSKRQLQDISTILHFNTSKDCTAYVTFPHSTAANMIQG